MLEAAHERLDVEHVPEEAGLDGAAHRHEVGVPAAVLIDREHPVVRRRRPDDLVGLGHGQAERLLADHVLAGAQEIERQRRMERGWRGHERHLDVVVGHELARGRVAPHAGEIRLRRLPPLDVRIGDGDQLDPLGLGHAEPVVVAHAAERTVSDDPDTDIAAAAVEIGAQRPGEELDERPAYAARRPCCRDRTRPRARRRPIVSTTAAWSRSATRTFDDGLAGAERDQRHEPVDHRELARCAVGDVGVRRRHRREVLAGRRLRAGDHAQEVRPETMALGRRGADADQRDASLHRRAERPQGLDGLRRRAPVDHDRVVLGRLDKAPSGWTKESSASPCASAWKAARRRSGETAGKDEHAHRTRRYHNPLRETAGRRPAGRGHRESKMLTIALHPAVSREASRSCPRVCRAARSRRRPGGRGAGPRPATPSRYEAPRAGR